METRKPEAPRVLTLVMLGTGKHHETDKTILTQLVTAVASGSNQTTHLIDGVGGKSKEGSEDPMLGTYDFAVESFNPENGKLKVRKTPNPGKSSFRTQLGGVSHGVGYRDAMDESLQIVEAMVNGDTAIKEGKKQLVINMAGFSRGADTLIRVSNMLAARYPDVKMEVNILAIDPVPGPMRAQARKASLIPDIVKNLVVVSMKHEKRPGFRPQDTTRLTIQDPEKTNVSQLILSGVHRQAIRFLTDPNKTVKSQEARENTQESAHLLWHKMHEFFRQGGTEFNHPVSYVYRDNKKQDHVVPNPREGKTSRIGESSNAARLQWYNQMIQHEPFYKKIARMAIKNLPGTQRKFALDEKRSNYFLHGTEIFQDKEHMLLFKSVYPAMFDYYFQQNGEGYSYKALMQDVNLLKKNDRDAVTILSKLGAPAKKGMNLIAEYFYLNKELLIAKDKYPDFFDYFYRGNDNVNKSSVLEQVQSIRNDADVAGLLVALPDLNEGKDQEVLLPPARHMPDADNELSRYKELVRLYDGVTSICQPVLVQRDSSEKVKEAQIFLNKIQGVLRSPGGVEEKIQMIHAQIQEYHPEKPNLFGAKLNALIGRANSQFDDVLVAHVLTALGNTSNKKIEPAERELLQAIQIILERLRDDRERDRGNDARMITLALQSALQRSGVYLREGQAQLQEKKEGVLDKVLRRCLSETITSAIPEVEKWKMTRTAYRKSVSQTGMFQRATQEAEKKEAPAPATLWTPRKGPGRKGS